MTLFATTQRLHKAEAPDFTWIPHQFFRKPFVIHISNLEP